jgi:hypothetical protein
MDICDGIFNGISTASLTASLTASTVSIIRVPFVREPGRLAHTCGGRRPDCRSGDPSVGVAHRPGMREPALATAAVRARRRGGRLSSDG